MHKKRGFGGVMAFFKSLFLKFCKKNKELPQPDKYEDLNNRNVMVGTVRSSEQLDFNLDKNGYYVPARFISKYNLPLEYIALYEDYGGEFSGIRYMGKVLSSHKVRRKKIPVSMSRKNPNEIYYYFQVESWEMVTNTISATDLKSGAPVFTSKILIDNCRHSFELISVTSDAQFRLLKAIYKITDLHKNNETESEMMRVNEYYSLALRHGNISVIKSGVEIYSESVDSYEKHRKKSFYRFKTVVETEDILKRLR